MQRTALPDHNYPKLNFYKAHFFEYYQTLYHYTNKEGFEGITKTSMLKVDKKGYTYLTDNANLGGTGGHNYLFGSLRKSKYAGKLDYRIKLKVPSNTKLKISKGEPIEYIYKGDDLRIKILNATKNTNN